MTKAGSMNSLSLGSKLGTMVVIIPNHMPLLGRLAPPVRQPVPNGQSIEPKWSFSRYLSRAPSPVRRGQGWLYVQLRVVVQVFKEVLGP
jgi:hypothetical protein